MSSRPVFIATPFIFLLIAYFVDYVIKYYLVTKNMKIKNKKYLPRAQMTYLASSGTIFIAAPFHLSLIMYFIYYN